MRLQLLLTAVICGGVGCAEPTQTVVLDPTSAARLASRYGSRVEIVRRADAPSQDDVVVKIRVRQGDEIPGVGVVRAGTSTELIVGGAVTLTVGTAALVGAVASANSCPPPSSGWGLNLNHGFCELGWGVLGAIGGGVALTGLVLMIQGITPSNLYLDRSARVSLAPVVQRNGGGAALQWRF